ncbi:MAG: hypothetical protein M1415_05200 [Firmicutes bacterium]|nr:hypothetical protein [Bacillota bacterium]MCL5064512.1 hypothetical protein [Bacillota bacterium]
MAKKLPGTPPSLAWVPKERLQVSVASGRLCWPEPWEARVDVFWREEIEKTSPQFFCGPLLTVLGITWEATVQVQAQFTDYAHFLYSRRYGQGMAELAVRPVFAAALPITLDDRLVIGKMGAGTHRPGRIQCIGGTAIDGDVKGGGFDAETSADREMLEEIGVGRGDESLSERGVVGATVDPEGGVAVAVAYDVHQSWPRFRRRIESFFLREREEGRTTELDEVLAVPLGTDGIAQLNAWGDVGPRYLRRFLTVPEISHHVNDPRGVVGE